MARILILGAGTFGRLAAELFQGRGHDARIASRSRADLLVDAHDADEVAHAARRVSAHAILQTAGPFQAAPPAAAIAAKRLRLPYADITDDATFAGTVKALGVGAALLTGMSTTPAVAGALAELLRKRKRRTASMRLGLFTGAGNRPGSATFRFASRARLPGAPETVEFPGAGTRRAYPAKAFFGPPAGLPGRTVVAVGGVAGIGWRFRWLSRRAAWLAPRTPTMGRDTTGSLVVDGFNEAGSWVGREGLHAGAGGQRLAVLPAVWALEEAIGGRAPRKAVLPSEWVRPETLVEFLESQGFERTSA